jgi:hypothetical protein
MYSWLILQLSDSTASNGRITDHTKREFGKKRAQHKRNIISAFTWPEENHE